RAPNEQGRGESLEADLVSPRAPARCYSAAFMPGSVFSSGSPGGLIAALLLGCSTPMKPWVCQIPDDTAPPDAVSQIGCEQDFLPRASEPLAPSIAGARSVKTSIDREAEFALRFQNSLEYPVHWDYLKQNRSAEQGLPLVPQLDQFNGSEYYSPDR